MSKDFAGSSNTSPLEFEEANLPAVISEVVSQTPAPTTHSAGLPPDTVQSDNKELDDALDQLSDSLGQRQPDPDENKPIEDKVKERAKAEHRDKLGERDDTIPLNIDTSWITMRVNQESHLPRKPRTQRSLKMTKTPSMPCQATSTAVLHPQKPQRTQQRTKPRELLPAPKHRRIGVKQRILQRQSRKLPSPKLMKKIQVKVHAIWYRPIKSSAGGW